MLITLEGLDRTGKSTLAQELVVRTGAKYIHAEKPKHHPLDEYVRPLESYQPGAGRSIVLDRWDIGEQVWPQMFGRASELDDPALMYINLFMASRGRYLVHMRRPVDEVIEACVRDGEPLYDIPAAAKLFDARCQVHGARDFFLNGMTSVEQLLEFAQAAEDYVASAHKYTSRWIGSPTPDVLLVGEQVGPSSRGWTLPFVPYRGTSGHFLMGELPLLYSVAIVNALTPAGRLEKIPHLWRALDRPRIVALGKVADDVLNAHGLPHGTTYHPQYVRRFKRSEGPGYYHDLILGAAFAS